MTDAELEHVRSLEWAVEARRRAHRLDEARRHRGVCWSGMTGEGPEIRDDIQIEAAVQARLKRRNAWREGPDAAFVAAISACQAAARETFAAAERARAGAARGEGAAWRQAIARDLVAHAKAVASTARQLRRAAEL